MKRSRLTFYAPLKAPDHSHPSGDRRMAALLMQALQLADYDVVLASRFRSYDHVGDPLRQSRIHHLGQALAGRLLRHYVRTGDAPDFWFTYHLYHKAPDWIGPQVAQALQIPYIVAEASLAPKQVDGNWASGHQAVAHALLRTDLVVHLNPDDETCVTPLLGARASSLNLAPFMDLGPLPDPKERNKLRRQLTFEQGIDPGSFWLVCTAMMRPGDKFSSYRMLAHSLRSLLDLPWRLLVIGDGKCRDQVKSLFVDIDQRCCWLGQCEHETVLEILTASDLYLWPGINEAYGLALLEAQACGLPVVTGLRPGPATIVRHRQSGLLPPEGNGHAFSLAVRSLLENPGLLQQFAAYARTTIANKHGLQPAASRLAQAIRAVSRS